MKGTKMPDLTELELEHIRQIIFLNENKYQKINIISFGVQMKTF